MPRDAMGEFFLVQSRVQAAFEPFQPRSAPDGEVSSTLGFGCFPKLNPMGPASRFPARCSQQGFLCKEDARTFRIRITVKYC